MSRSLTPVCAALVLAFPVAVFAQAATDATTLKAVTVSDAPYREDLSPQNAKNPFRTPESSSGHVQTITREDIEQLRPADVFELVNMATGVVATPQSRAWASVR
jgi:outer membrane cobalamin receptor